MCSCYKIKKKKGNPIHKKHQTQMSQKSTKNKEKRNKQAGENSHFLDDESSAFVLKARKC